MMIVRIITEIICLLSSPHLFSIVSSTLSVLDCAAIMMIHIFFSNGIFQVLLVYPKQTKLNLKANNANSFVQILEGINAR